MKRLLLAALLALPAFASGTVQQNADYLPNNVVAITFNWTGDPVNGSVPVTAVMPGVAMQGLRIIGSEITPGTPNPTASYTIKLIDSAGVDLLNGGGSALSATSAASIPGAVNSPPVFGTFSLTITGQNAASAVGIITVYLAPLQQTLGLQQSNTPIFPSQAANQVFASPNGASGQPGFRNSAGADFGSQAANVFLASPNGSVGNMGIRSIMGPDVPPIDLTIINSNGGVKNLLPIGQTTYTLPSWSQITGTKQGNSNVPQMAGTNSGAVGAALCDDANGNATTTGCAGGFSLPSGLQLQYLRLQPNTGNNTTAQFAYLPTGDSVLDYQYPPQTCNGSNNCSAGGANGASLTGGNAATLTMVPCPLGIKAGSIWAPIYLSGGSGTAEAVTPTSGTCTSGAASGTIVVTPLNSHSGAFTVQTATAGWQEAANAAGANQSIYFPCSATPYTMYASFNVPFNNQTYFADSPDCVSLTQANGANVARRAIVGAMSDVTFLRLGWDNNFINQTSVASTTVAAIDLSNSVRAHVLENRFHAFGFTPLGSAAANITHFSNVLYCSVCQSAEIRRNRFYSIWAFEGEFLGGSNITISDNVSGANQLTEANTPTNSWDNMEGGYGWYLSGLTDSEASRNTMFGGNQDFAFTVGLSIIQSYGNTRMKFTGNWVTSISTGVGTIAVTNGSGTVTGTGTLFNCGAGSGPTYVVNGQGLKFVIEGDTTAYTIASCASTTSMTVTPTVARATASGLRFQAQQSADLFISWNTTFSEIADNTILFGWDHGMDVGTNDGASNSWQNHVHGNTIISPVKCGINVQGRNRANSFVGNYIYNSGAGQFAGNRGGFCFTSNDGVANRAVDFNYFGENTVFQGDFPSATAYFMELDSTNFAQFTGNLYGPNNFPYADTTLKTFDGTAAVISAIFPGVTTTGPQAPLTITFASLASIGNSSGTAVLQGYSVFCTDCKNVKDDSVTAGAVCSSGGHGARATYANASWGCN